MAIINNNNLLQEVAIQYKFVENAKYQPLIMEPYVKDFSYRFCWSSNALEGSTLSLDETVSLIEYDEVRSGHTYTEYHEAKNLYKAIKNQMIPFREKEITQEWIQATNGYIMGNEGMYRKDPVYIGSLAEVVYYPPQYEKVPAMMDDFQKSVNFRSGSISEIFEKVAKSHINFERIHPFKDGNGRTGRMILNQQLINNGLFPVSFSSKGKYRQAFRIYNKNGDISSMVHILAKAELLAINRIKQLQHNLNRSMDMQINQE